MINRLNYILSELSQYKRDKEYLMQYYVSKRLDKSFDSYNKELQQSVDFLTKKHEKSLIKRMNKSDDKSTK